MEHSHSSTMKANVATLGIHLKGLQELSGAIAKEYGRDNKEPSDHRADMQEAIIQLKAGILCVSNAHSLASKYYSGAASR